MEEQERLQAEEVQDVNEGTEETESAELSDEDLEKVAGGMAQQYTGLPKD